MKKAFEWTLLVLNTILFIDSIIILIKRKPMDDHQWTMLMMVLVGSGIIISALITNLLTNKTN